MKNPQRRPRLLASYPTVARFRGIDDPADRLAACAQFLTTAPLVSRGVRMVRDETIRELRTAGWSPQQIAGFAGIGKDTVADALKGWTEQA